MTLESWLAAPLAHALGRALLHFLWEGAVLALSLRVVLFLGARRPARRRHQVAATCLIALPLAFGLTVALLLGPGPSIAVAVPPQAPRMVLHPVIAAGTSAAPVDRLAWLAPLWMGGVILFYAFRLAGWLRVDSMRRRGVCAAPAEWQQRLGALASAVQVSQPVVLLESCLARVPLVVGYWRPVILMPLGALTGLSAEQVEAILIHELAHIRRADYLVSLAQSLIEGLFFFHPAVWWISAVVRAEREYSCDDVVVTLRPDARAYAAALTTLEQSRWAALEAVPAATGGNLVKRIRRLLGEPSPARVTNARASALAGVLVLVAVVATALAVWPTSRGFAQGTSKADSAQATQDQASGREEAKLSLHELEQSLAGNEKEIEAAKEALDHAQQLLQKHAAELEKALQDAGAGDAQHEDQLRQAERALKELEEAQAGKSQELLQQQEQSLEQAEKQILDAERASEATQAGTSSQLLQQKRALERAQNQLQQLMKGKLEEMLSQQQRQMADADQALKQWQATNGTKQQAELQQQLEQARKQLERAAQSCCRSRDLLAEAPESPAPQTKTEPESAYQRWLKEDVAYIITDQERRAYQALETDPERERFIEQFWLRRDPTPGTAENEFKEEHYRRIAYANEHYASGIPGWKTDRGRIYIVYGPPDEIEDHSTDSTPRQDWLYVHIDGLGYAVEVQFSDPGRTGEFRMVGAPASHGSYWLIQSDVKAAYAARLLRDKGFPALAQSISGMSGHEQVLVGPYPDEAALAKAKAAIEAAGYHPTKVQ